MGPTDLYEKHLLLKDKKGRRRQIEADLKQATEQRERCLRRKTQIEPEVQSFEKRRQFEEKIMLLNKKRPWVVS